MCGIFGLININQKPIDRKILEKGLQKIQHRGPDGNGYYISSHIGLAACRLAIMDKSNLSAQPFIKDKLILIFNGAIYNYKELRQELERAGIRFQTTGDTEVVLEAFRHWGSACLNRFNGMWAIAIYNELTQSIFLARDRFGIKPLYYMAGSDQFAFASEIKAFTHLSSWQRRTNPKVLGQYLAYGMQDFSEETLFDSVKHVPAAHFGEFDLRSGRFDLQRYYSLPVEQRGDVDVGEAIEEFSVLLNDAIEKRQLGEVSVGASLSGGIDSSSIVCRAFQLQERINTFSVIYPGSDVDESSYVAEVNAAVSSKPHLLSPPMQDLWSRLDDVIYAQDEPFSSASICAQHELFRCVSNTDVKVVLDGQGADEVLGGYESFLASSFRNVEGSVNKAFFLFQAARHSGLSFGKSIERWGASKSKQAGSQGDWLKLPIEMGQQLTDQNTLDTSTRLLSQMGLQALLHYADRNSMAFGIETRVPFLDYRLVDFCMKLPDNLKIKKGYRKWLLKESGKSILPDSIYERKDKIGFETPQKNWMKKNHKLVQDEAKEYAKQMPTIINSNRLNEIRSDAELWRIICAGKWMTIFELNL